MLYSFYCYLVRNKCDMIFPSEIFIYEDSKKVGDCTNIMYELFFVLSDNLFALNQVSTLLKFVFILDINCVLSLPDRKKIGVISKQDDTCF